MNANPPHAPPKGGTPPRLAFPGELPHSSAAGSANIDQIGLAAVLLWLNAHRWIHRRAESMMLHDASVGSRSLRLSFTVPENVPSFDVDGIACCCLPVSLLRKHKVDLFCLTDGEGSEFPLLARETRGRIASAGLVRMASALIQTALKQPLPDDIRADLELAVNGKPTDAVTAMNRFEGIEPIVDPVSAACRALLMGYEAFRLVTWSLALNSMILIRLPYVPCSYQTLTAQYDEPLNEVPPGRGAKRLLRAAFRTSAITPKKLWFPVRLLPEPSSNHYRVAAPDGLQISAATLAAEQLEPAPSSEVVASRSASHPSVQETIGISDRWEERDRETGSLGGTHLYDRELPEHSVALVRVNLRPTASGTLRAIWFTAGISVLLLAITDAGLGVIRNGKDVSTAAQSASALLLLIPTLLAAYVARPGEHTLTSELLFGTRLLGLLAGSTTLAGAAYLVFTDRSRDLGGNWTVLLAAAGAVLLVLTVSYLINWAMVWPEGDPDSEAKWPRKVRARLWIYLRRRLG